MSKAKENEIAMVHSTMISRQQSNESTMISSRKPLVMLIIENIGLSSKGLGRHRLNGALLRKLKKQLISSIKFPQQIMANKLRNSDYSLIYRSDTYK